MSVTASGLYYLTFKAALINSVALNLDAETYKGALFTDTITPNFDTDTAYTASPYTSNECTTVTYWPSGGVVLTNTTFTVTTGTLKFDADDVSQVSTTLTNAKCYLWHATGVTEECIVLVNFGGNYSTNNGTFGITWAAGGIFTIDLTP